MIGKDIRMTSIVTTHYSPSSRLSFVKSIEGALVRFGGGVAFPTDKNADIELFLDPNFGGSSGSSSPFLISNGWFYSILLSCSLSILR